MSFSGSPETTQDDSEEVKTVISKIDEALCAEIYKIHANVSSNTLLLLSNAIMLKHSEICQIKLKHPNQVERQAAAMCYAWANLHPHPTKKKLLLQVITGGFSAEWFSFSESCVFKIAGLYAKRTANHIGSLWPFIEYATVLLNTDVTFRDTDIRVTAGPSAPPLDQPPSNSASSNAGPAHTIAQIVKKSNSWKREADRKGRN